MTFPRIRSRLLSASYHVGAATLQVLYLGEATSVILKSIHMQRQDGTASEATVYLVHGTSVQVIVSAELAGGATLEWNGWVVLQDNDAIRVVSGGNTLTWWMSGTLLQGVIDQTITPIGAAVLPALPIDQGAAE